MTNLRVACGDTGAWGPIPHYAPHNNGQRFGAKPSRGQKLAHLIESYLEVLSPLKYLKNLSLDVHLTDATVYPPDHLPPNPHIAFLAQQQFNFFQGLLINPAFLPPLPIALPQPVTPVDEPCTGDNHCTKCWEVRIQGTHRREILAAKILARGLKYLETVEWTIWFRERGAREERRRVCIDRSLVLEEVGSSPVKGVYRPVTVGQQVSHHPKETDDADDAGTEDDILLKEANVFEFACRTIKVPLALYPAVLG